ncbi:hypothetical protein RND71_038520 [Anisodus tanguticus]|uniref:Uncharacterized protein n=1 Tax=Anisodus tanguticus TaxID=243964 RepID=A0AAE1QZ76_9SOLA|nr:hypothetical protein RND71_038520 [Anisodus tanguticus]
MQSFFVLAGNRTHAVHARAPYSTQALSLDYAPEDKSIRTILDLHIDAWRELSRVFRPKFSSQFMRPDVTEGSVGLVTRNQAKFLGQQAPRAQPKSVIVFGSSAKHVRSLANTAKEGEDVTQMVERVLAQLSLSKSKKSLTLADDDVLSTGFTPHNMSASSVHENLCYSPSFMMVMHAMMTNSSIVEEQLASLTKAIGDLTKYMQEQDNRIVKLTDKFYNMIEGDRVMHLENIRKHNKRSTLLQNKWNMLQKSKRYKTSPQKELAKQQTKEKMVRKLKVKNTIARSKKEKMEGHHYQEPCRTITLGEYLPSWFRTKFVVDDVKDLCCTVDEEEAQNTTSSCPSSKDPSKENVAIKEDKMPTIVNKVPNTNGASSSKKGILRYVSKDKKDEGGTLGGLIIPVKKIDTIKSSAKLLGKFVAPNLPQNEALPMKHTEEGFDPNDYKLLTKARYNPNEPSKLGKLPLEPIVRK